MIRAKGAELLDLSQEILAGGRRVRFTATGASMQPFIKDGDVVEIEPVEGGDVAIGDIIFFHQSSSRPVVHRVIARRKDGDEVSIVTRGDNALTADNLVATKQILGKVVVVERDGSRMRLDTPFRRWFGRLRIGIAPARVISRRALSRVKRVIR